MEAHNVNEQKARDFRLMFDGIRARAGAPASLQTTAGESWAHPTVRSIAENMPPKKSRHTKVWREPLYNRSV